MTELETAKQRIRDLETQLDGLARSDMRYRKKAGELQAENKRLRYGIEILKTIRHNIKAGAVTTQWIENFIDIQALREKPK